MWLRPVAVAALRPLASEPLYAAGAALESKRKKKKRKEKKLGRRHHWGREGSCGEIQLQAVGRGPAR